MAKNEQGKTKRRSRRVFLKTAPLGIAAMLAACKEPTPPPEPSGCYPKDDPKVENTHDEKQGDKKGSITNKSTDYVEFSLDPNFSSVDFRLAPGEVKAGLDPRKYYYRWATKFNCKDNSRKTLDVTIKEGIMPDCYPKEDPKLVSCQR